MACVVCVKNAVGGKKGLLVMVMIYVFLTSRVCISGVGLHVGG